MQVASQEVGAAPPSVHVPHSIPPPSRLRGEARIQEEVQSRLRHLADNVKPGMTKLKSQRGGSVDVFVNHKVSWPHEFVLSGQNKDRVTYNQLSPAFSTPLLTYIMYSFMSFVLYVFKSILVATFIV